MAPAATVTLPETVTLVLLLDKVTTDPPVSAAALRVTVQAADPGDATLAGLHEIPVSDGSGVWIETLPPTLAAGIDEPSVPTATGFVMAMAAVPPGDEEGTPSVMVATTPLAIAASFMPSRTHTTVPAPVEHDGVVPAAAAAAPAAMLTPENCVEG